jgi:hypothetical protein
MPQNALKMCRKVDECKPLAFGSAQAAAQGWDVLWGDEPRRQLGRGLHSPAS